MFGPVGGAIVDRSDRRRLVIAVNLVRAAGVAAFALAVATGHASLVLLYAVALLVGFGEVLADSAYQSLIPLVAPRGRLDAANGRWSAAELVANEFLGGPVGSFLFAAAAALPFAVDAVSFGVGAAGLTQVHAPAAGARSASSTRLLDDVVDGLRWLWRHRMLRTFAICLALTNAGWTAGSALLVLLVTDTLGAGPIAYGWVIAAGAWGTRRLARRRARRPQAGQGAHHGRDADRGGRAVPRGRRRPSTWLLAAVWAAIVLATGVFNVVGRSLRQMIVPDRLMGRVVGAYRLFGYGAVPLGALSGGVIATAFGVRAAFVAGFAVNLLAAVLLARAATETAIAQAVSAAERPRRLLTAAQGVAVAASLTVRTSGTRGPVRRNSVGAGRRAALGARRTSCAGASEPGDGMATDDGDAQRGSRGFASPTSVPVHRRRGYFGARAGQRGRGGTATTEAPGVRTLIPARDEVAQQRLDSAVDLVADDPHLLQWPARRVCQLPVQVALAGIDRTGVSAPHGDHHVSRLDDLVGPRLGELLGDVQADLGHRVGDVAMDLLGWRRPGRADAHRSLRVVVEQRGCHLTPPGVVDADEQDLRDFFHDGAFQLTERAQPLTREAVHEHRQEPLHPRDAVVTGGLETTRATVSGEKTPANSRARASDTLPCEPAGRCRTSPRRSSRSSHPPMIPGHPTTAPIVTTADGRVVTDR